jgi:hypothetical protein
MIVRRPSTLVPALNVVALSAFSIGTAVHVGCTHPQDDGTREDRGPLAYDSGASPAETTCSPAPGVVVLQTPEPAPTCTEFCRSQGMKCNDQGFATVMRTFVPTFPYTEGPSCHHAGRRVDYSCSSCYSGSVYMTCDGAVAWSTTNHRSGPYAGTYCACSP